jgi:hypothetical protein
MTRAAMLDRVGGLSNPSKMPCHGYSIPAVRCFTGSKLREVPGSVCGSCYALKGRYVFPNVQQALERRYLKVTAALADAEARQEFVAAFVALLGRETYFRWHDSGDLQSVAHLKLIADIATATPHVKHWLPTREYRIVRDYQQTVGALPENLTVRVSAHMMDGKAPDLGLPVSTVHTGNVPATATECRAYTRGGHCGECRACWQPEVVQISYRKH